MDDRDCRMPQASSVSLRRLLQTAAVFDGTVGAVEDYETAMRRAIGPWSNGSEQFSVGNQPPLSAEG
jgi:hypothetical protein